MELHIGILSAIFAGTIVVLVTIAILVLRLLAKKSESLKHTFLVEKNISQLHENATPAEKQYALLRNYHAQGLAQSKTSFACSIVFGATGFAVIVLSVLLLFFSEHLTSNPFEVAWDDARAATKDAELKSLSKKLELQDRALAERANSKRLENEALTANEGAARLSDQRNLLIQRLESLDPNEASRLMKTFSSLRPSMTATNEGKDPDVAAALATVSLREFLENTLVAFGWSDTLDLELAYAIGDFLSKNAVISPGAAQRSNWTNRMANPLVEVRFIEQMGRYDWLFLQVSNLNKSLGTGSSGEITTFAAKLHERTVRLLDDQRKALSQLQEELTQKIDPVNYSDRVEQVGMVTKELSQLELAQQGWQLTNGLKLGERNAASAKAAEIQTQIDRLDENLKEFRERENQKRTAFRDDQDAKGKNRSATLKSAAGIIGVISGVILDAIAALFFVQSNRARALMTEFFDRLRTDRRFEEGLEITDKIADSKVKAEVQAKLALALTSVVLERKMPGDKEPEKKQSQRDKPTEPPKDQP